MRTYSFQIGTKYLSRRQPSLRRFEGASEKSERQGKDEGGFSAASWREQFQSSERGQRAA